jgi:hypothetical protein
MDEVPADDVKRYQAYVEDVPDEEDMAQTYNVLPDSSEWREHHITGDGVESNVVRPVIEDDQQQGVQSTPSPYTDENRQMAQVPAGTPQGVHLAPDVHQAHHQPYQQIYPGQMDNPLNGYTPIHAHPQGIPYHQQEQPYHPHRQPYHQQNPPYPRQNQPYYNPLQHRPPRPPFR